MDYETLKCFIMNFSLDLNNFEAIKGTSGISKLPDFRNLVEEANYSNLLKQPFRSRSLLEIYLKKFLQKKTADYTENNLREFDFWLGFFLDNYKYWQENESVKKKYKVCLNFLNK